jgi:hypothetical protein
MSNIDKKLHAKRSETVGQTAKKALKCATIIDGECSRKNMQTSLDTSSK